MQDRPVPATGDGFLLTDLSNEALAVYSGTITPDGTSRDLALASLDLLKTAMTPWMAETAYINFAES